MTGRAPHAIVGDIHSTTPTEQRPRPGNGPKKMDYQMYQRRRVAARNCEGGSAAAATHQPDERLSNKATS